MISNVARTVVRTTKNSIALEWNEPMPRPTNFYLDFAPARPKAIQAAFRAPASIRFHGVHTSLCKIIAANNLAGNMSSKHQLMAKFCNRGKFSGVEWQMNLGCFARDAPNGVQGKSKKYPM